jgi:hypothetical protein
MNQPRTRLVIHLCEGTDQTTRAPFSNLIDPNGKPLISSNLISIHGTALGLVQLAVLTPAGVRLVSSEQFSALRHYH